MPSLQRAVHGNRLNNKVAITFDDGPNPYATPLILDILKQENCKASFFCIGRWAEKYPDIVMRTIAEGHVIGGHTYMHGGDDRKMSYGEFIKGNQSIEKITGQKVRFVRVPKFGYDQIDNGIYRVQELLTSLKEKIEHQELVVVGADIDTNDWHRLTPKRIILFNAMRNLKNGSIIDLHDGSEKEHEMKNRADRTVQVLPELIKRIRLQGFEPVSLNEMDLVFSDITIP